VVELLAAPRPVATVAAGGRYRTVAELERERAVAGVEPDRPPAAAGGDVAARVDQARPGLSEDPRGAIDGVALCDPSEIEVDPRAELDPPRLAIHTDRACAAESRRRPGIAAASVCGHLDERAVVAGHDDGVVHGRIDAAEGSIACGERELHDPQEVGTCVQASRTVEPRELGVRQEAGEQPLEAMQLGFGGEQSQPPGALVLRLDEQLDVRPLVAILPGLVIFFTVLSLNVMSDAFREKFDVREAAI